MALLHSKQSLFAGSSDGQARFSAVIRMGLFYRTTAAKRIKTPIRLAPRKHRRANGNA